MEFKGTKGTWEVLCESGMIANNIDIIAMTPSDKYKTPESVADAKLIAASPDLLKALINIIDPTTGLVADFIAKEIGNKKAYAIEQAINKALN